MSEALSPILLEARPDWNRTFRVEWAALDEIDDGGQTINSFTVSFSPSGPSATGKTISNTRTLFNLDCSSFNTDTVYTLTIQVTTSGGQVIDREGKLIVRSA